MRDERDEILEQLNPLIAEFISKAQSGRFQNPETSKLRISYANALASLIRAYNGLLKDKEIEELKEELETLKNEFDKSD